MLLVRLCISRLRSFSCPHQRLVCSRAIMSSRPAEEVRFPVPWGHIAGLAWGNPKGRPVLALHGWLDNAGSFNTLIPLLSEEFYVVAVDWPGHGHSSHRPPGALYASHEYIADIKYIIDGLKWDKFSIIAHSMGGGAASWFAGALPERVETLVLLEGVGFWSESMDELPMMMGRALNRLSTLDKVENRSYSSWEAVLERIVGGHKDLDKLFDKECASILAERGTRKMADGTYQFTRDIKTKTSSILRVPHETNSVFLNAIQCPVLVTIGAESNIRQAFSDRLSMLCLNDNVKSVHVPGGHHVHLYQPEAVREVVNSFLLTQTLPPQSQPYPNRQSSE